MTNASITSPNLKTRGSSIHPLSPPTYPSPPRNATQTKTSPPPNPPYKFKILEQIYLTELLPNKLFYVLECSNNDSLLYFVCHGREEREKHTSHASNIKLGLL